MTSGVYPRKPEYKKPGPKPWKPVYTNIEPFKRRAPIPPKRKLMDLVLEYMK